MASALALGFLVGFPIAASPGPISVLVLRRTLARGWRSGLISGLGVATGDAIYAALAAFGVRRHEFFAQSAPVDWAARWHRPCCDRTPGDKSEPPLRPAPTRGAGTGG